MELTSFTSSCDSSTDSSSGYTDNMEADQTILFKHKKVKSKSDKFKYDHETPILNPFIIAENTMNQVDHVFLIHILAAALRILMAVCQLFVAIVDSFMRINNNKHYVIGQKDNRYVFGQKENHYKHAGLNLLRGLIGLFPIVGSIVLTNRDNSQIRCTYNNEITRNTVWRQLDPIHNNFRTHLKENKFEKADVGLAGLGSLASNILEIGKKAAISTTGIPS
jgi:hypothetical protein